MIQAIMRGSPSTLRRIGMLELCKFPIKSCISRFSTKTLVSELEPHMRLLGPFSDCIPFYVRTDAPSTTNFSKPKEPWEKNYYTPLPKSTGNPCLDLFLFKGAGTAHTLALLDSSWNHNPQTTLKLILYRIKLPRLGYLYNHLLWLYHKHPKTLASNLRLFVECGYLKCLPRLLYELFADAEDNVSTLNVVGRMNSFVHAYYGDENYRFLYNQISDIFSELLKSDLEFLKSGNLQKISHAVECCPSLNSFLDLTTFMCESIARRLFPQDSDSLYKRISEPQYAYRARDCLRKEVIAPLRRALNSPELYTILNKRSLLPSIPALNVPTELAKETLLTRNKDKHHNEALLTCNKERYMNYRHANTKIPVEELLPHKILCSLLDGGCVKLANLQWKKMIEHLTMKGKFKHCLACCDVSPSMNGFCTTISIALGLLISDLSQGPWRGKVMTFSHDPQLQKIEGIDLQCRTDFMEFRMDWGLKIDLRKVFLHILEVATKENIDKDNMVKTIFVFTSMEFSEMSYPNSWDIDHQEIRNKFHESGYTSLPVLVFWNLSRDHPNYSFVRDINVLRESGYGIGLGLLPNGPQGVTLIKGFSNELLKLAIENNGVLNPIAVMEMIISDKRYEKAIVCD
ncbi:hypothetical protein FH972_003409 [Carpinus fangiana]|uniref:Uncharacterized protein n=1 Tax=Carpinus fangiana TaxID=176857 RepID=A0A5N6QHX5_9ROSI|nr:hypothetical protein FH972_003409 [Carpinus fangiana]